MRIFDRTRSAILLAATMLATTTVALPAWAATLRLGVPQDALTVDPIASSDNPSIWTELLIYDQLVRPSKDGTKLEPSLAESWTVAPDGKEFRFHLRDATFSNGQKVTAADVAFSLKRAAGEKSEWGRFFRPITSYEVVDDNTIVMKLDKPFTPMLNNLAMFSASILPANLVQEHGDKFFETPVGSGPFILKSWSRGQRQELVRNPGYWQAGKPALDGVVVEVVPEDNSRVLKLKAGELDAIIGVPVNQADSLRNDPAIQVGVAPVFRIDMVQLNNSKPPFNDVRVRQALNYALDKDALIKGILRGNATPASSSIPVMAYHNTAIQPYPMDLVHAKALLTEAGLPNGFKSTMLVAGGDTTGRQVAAAIQALLKKTGIEIEIRTIEGSSLFSTTKTGNYEMALSHATSDTIDPDQSIGFTAVNPERANAYHTQWRDDRVNELYAEERTTPDGPERGKLFQEMEARIHDGAPFIFLWTPNELFATRKTVTGFAILPTANYDLTDVTMR